MSHLLQKRHARKPETVCNKTKEKSLHHLNRVVVVGGGGGGGGGGGDE